MSKNVQKGSDHSYFRAITLLLLGEKRKNYQIQYSSTIDMPRTALGRLFCDHYSITFKREKMKQVMLRLMSNVNVPT